MTTRDYLSRGYYWSDTPDAYWTNFYWTIAPTETPAPPTCFVTIPPPYSVASYYFVTISDYDNNVVAIFDNWRELTLQNIINDAGDIEMLLNGKDERVALIQDDYLITVYRSVPGVSLDWYVEARGLIEIHKDDILPNGDQVYRITACHLNGHLSRRRIAYLSGTIRADKIAPGETAMKEYVTENIGAGATVANGRLLEGSLSNFTIAIDGAQGNIYQKGNSGASLLDVCKDIALTCSLDFLVYLSLPNTYIFQVYPALIGEDRRAVNIDPETGFNGAGLAPVRLSVGFGNVVSQSYTHNRREEVNAAIIWGNGSGATQQYAAGRNLVAISATPYAQRETARSGQNQEYQYQLDQEMQKTIDETPPQDDFTFEVLQQPSAVYGKHFTLGDRLTVLRGATPYQKRLVQTTINITGDNKREQIRFDFEDAP